MFMNIFFIGLVCLTINSNLVEANSKSCDRDCRHATPMDCRYNFNAENYYVRSRACLDCSRIPSTGGFDVNDCLRRGCISADGVDKSITVINRQLPGPQIIVCKGDTIIVDVTNSLDSFESFTIHWHGIHQRGTQHMDGVGNVHQCPIQPNNKFQYKFKAAQPGTHMWHAYTSGLRDEGIHGALIVHDSWDPNRRRYDFDLSENIMVLNDWTYQKFIDKYTKILHAFGDETVNSILINGKGVINRGGVTDPVPPAIFTCRSGKKMRFRVINSGEQFCPLEVSIEGHKSLTIIALDGNPVEPKNCGSIILMIGERVDFIVDCDATPDNYWVKVKGHADCNLGGGDGIFQLAVLNYEEVIYARPVTSINYPMSGGDTVPLCNPFSKLLDDSNQLKYVGIDTFRSKGLEALDYTDHIKGVVKSENKHYLALDTNTVKNTNVYDYKSFKWELNNPNLKPWATPQINNMSFLVPHTPFFWQDEKIPKYLFCNEFDRDLACPRFDPKDKFDFCRCIHLINVDLDELVEVILVDGGSQGENHPFHLHGFKFAVLAMDKIIPEDDSSLLNIKDVIKTDNLDKLKVRNFDNPPLKDTIQVNSGGYTIIRFLADNPGYWLLHSHLDGHAETGMTLVFKVGTDKDLSRDQGPRPSNWPQCGYHFKSKNSFREDRYDETYFNEFY